MTLNLNPCLVRCKLAHTRLPGVARLSEAGRSGEAAVTASGPRSSTSSLTPSRGNIASFSNIIVIAVSLNFNSPQTIVDLLLIRSVRVMFSLSDDPRSELWCENSEPEPESPASPGWCRLSLLSLRHTAIPSNSWHYLSPLWVRLSTIEHKR